MIDISGLTEPAIAYAPGGFLTKQYPVEWVLDRKPRWIALRTGWSFLDLRISVHHEFLRQYTKVLEVRSPDTMELFERTDLDESGSRSDEDH